MKTYEERAKTAWAERMKGLGIDETNIMIEQTTEGEVILGGSSATWSPA